MRRIAVVPLAALVLFGLAEEASAQETVRVNVRIQKGHDFADVFVERNGSWTMPCQAPCSFDATPGETVRVDVQGDASQRLTFTVPSDGTRTHDIEVRRRGDDLLVGGLVAIGAGAVSLALGMAIIRGAGKEDLFGSGNRAVAPVMMLLGAGSAGAGAYLILTRSTAPFLVPANRTQALEDLAPTRSTASTPAAPSQLVWSLPF
jgi:hypothetical protein